MCLQSWLRLVGGWVHPCHLYPGEEEGSDVDPPNSKAMSALIDGVAPNGKFLVIGDVRLKRGFIAASCGSAPMSGTPPHRRPLIIVDQVSPESIRAAAQDIGCRASEANMPAVGTCAIN